MEVITREAVPSDFDELQFLFSCIDEVHSDALPDTFRPPEEINRPKDLIEKFISDDKTALFVSEFNGSLVGLVHAEIRTANHPILTPKTYGHISDIVTHPKHRGKGVAALLMKHVDAWLNSKSVKEVNLTVFNFNKEAISFYENLGFTNLYTTMVKTDD